MGKFYFDVGTPKLAKLSFNIFQHLFYRDDGGNVHRVPTFTGYTSHNANRSAVLVNHQ